jgi:hypothetical protein
MMSPVLLPMPMGLMSGPIARTTTMLLLLMHDLPAVSHLQLLLRDVHAA